MAEALKTRIQSDLIRARKDRDRGRTLVLSTTLSELKNREIELGRDASDDDAILVLTRGIKQRRESAEQMRSGARADLAENEEAQADILKAYLPEQARDRCHEGHLVQCAFLLEPVLPICTSFD